MKKRLLCAMLMALWSSAGMTQISGTAPGTTVNSGASGASGSTTTPNAASGTAPSSITGGGVNTIPPGSAPQSRVGVTSGSTANPGSGAASGTTITTNPSSTATTGAAATTPSARATTGATSGASVGQGAGAAAAGNATQAPVATPPFDPRSAPGWSMMTPQEQQSYTDRMSSATTVAQCRASQDAYMAQMQARARMLGQVVQGPATDPCAALQKQEAVR